ncbi:MAG: hypothetical protein ACRC6U_07180, partial [Fusobacteriaceae bacterium]
MNQINIPITRYNPESPSDLTIIKDLPKAIRDKGIEIESLITNLEASKNGNSIKETLGYFPFVKSIFIQGNGNIPDALYCKKGESWVGYGNYDYLPTIDENSKDGDRITIHGKTYELILDEELKIWAEQPEVTPILFFDFFQSTVGSNSHTIENCGIGDKNITMQLNNMKKDDRFFVPYVITSKNSEAKTTSTLPILDRFTFSCIFNKIGREYLDGSEDLINDEHKAVLLFIRDEFENVKIGLVYDKDYNLYYINKTVVTPINKSIN